MRPQDDLYRAANGDWLRSAAIPADRARTGAFIELVDGAEEAVREILLAAADAEPGSEARKIGDAYAAFLDEERIEALGAAPLADDLSLVASTTSTAEVFRALGRLERTGVAGLLQLFVDTDPAQPSRYVVFVEQSGLGLPDERYYREDDFATHREAYRLFAETMFSLAGLDEPAERAARVLALETEIAVQHWDAVRTRDVQATYNPETWAGLLAAAKEAGPLLEGWAQEFDAPAAALDALVVREPSFVAGALGLLTDSRLDAWRDWLTLRVIRRLAPYLSSAFVDANFAFTGTALSGTEQLRDRWKRAVGFTEGILGEAVGRLYVEARFPPDAKAQMDVLVGNLVQAYRDSIGALDWLGEATRAEALTKLSKFTPKIGYPVRWRDYSTLEVHRDDLVATAKSAAAYEFARELGKLGTPVDRDEWFMTPQTVNAYYNPGMNEIVFPAAILQPPFFDPDRDAAANYGGIGAVIGHEIGHGFDDQGAQFDGDGKLHDWWTPDDKAAFEQRTKALIAQYDTLVPEGLTAHVNGALTVGENIGDLGGLTIAWRAYMLSLAGAEPPVIDGVTGAQRFFLSWAAVWREKRRQAESIRLLTIDPHSPPEFRCNQIVRNLGEFIDAFDVSETDALWLPPNQRVAIW